jgi:hypothetical protein
MTVDQFKEQVRKKDPFSDFSNYLMCVGFIMAGFYFYFQILTTSKSDGAYILLIIPTVLLLMGLYGFWRIPQTYEVVMIQSKVDVKIKSRIMQEYLSSLKAEPKSDKNNCSVASYTNEFGNKVDILYYVDSQKILFNVKKGNQFRYNRMFDFGVARRASEKIKSCLTEQLSSVPLKKQGKH